MRPPAICDHLILTTFFLCTRDMRTDDVCSWNFSNRPPAVCDQFSIAVDVVADDRFRCICPKERSILREHVRMRTHALMYVEVSIKGPISFYWVRHSFNLISNRRNIVVRKRGISSSDLLGHNGPIVQFRAKVEIMNEWTDSETLE